MNYTQEEVNTMNKQAIQEQHSQLVSTSFKNMDGRGGTQELLHAVIGIAGEVGELVDAVKKHWAYGKELDIENVVEELGDIEYYLEAFRQNLNVRYGTNYPERIHCLEANLTKLRKRYPGEVFTNAAAVARADKLEEELTKIRALPQTGVMQKGSAEWYEMQEARMREQESKKGGAL